MNIETVSAFCVAKIGGRCRQEEARVGQHALCTGRPGHPPGKMIKSCKKKYLSITSPEAPAKLYCCYVVITVLTVAVTALSVALAVRKNEQGPVKNTYAACPRHWIGFGNKCFHFAESTSNWTFSQASCVAQEAQLARFDNLEELGFLRRYKGTLDYWIGLHRESPQLPWRWTDNTEYNSTFPIRGVANHAYLSNNGISSARVYVDKRWICSKPNSYNLHSQNHFSSLCQEMLVGTHIFSLKYN
nr:C-type lectin domain family 2 member D11-like isoform X2 [Meriones unguiculatus]